MSAETRRLILVLHPQILPSWVALSSPSHKRPLVPRVERLARGVRQMAAKLEKEADIPFELLFTPKRSGLGFTLEETDVARRSAWALLGEWLVAAASAAPCLAEGLPAVHEWFWAGSGFSLGRVPAMPVLLESTDSSEIHALMPYLLDPMAAATRRDVLGALSTTDERRIRKATGVYYTPGDVANSMVTQLLSSSTLTRRELWLDPAHGSGVFLRAIFSSIADEAYSRDRIYGVDLDPLAAETASFVLTAEDLIHEPAGIAPWERWHRFRRNLATGDALLIDAQASDISAATLWASTPIAPFDGQPLGTSEPWRLCDVFPETSQLGFARIVANPPYAPLQNSPSNLHLAQLHPITGRNAAQDISPVFVELSADLLSDDGALAIVLPLSVISSTRAPFPELRNHLVSQNGQLEFLSFDRVPDALFGDDIKTRNAIIHLDKKAPFSVTASPLYRWTSRTRDVAMARIPKASIADLIGVPYSIPKIGSEWERRLFISCGAQSTYLDEWQIERRLSALSGLNSLSSEHLIAVAPTAYNFLSVIRDPAAAVAAGHNSQNSFSLMRFASGVQSSAAYAILSSRLAFWIWHTTGDGFHVTNALHRRLPVPRLGDESLERFAALGNQLWSAVNKSPLISNNKGRVTVAYPTVAYRDLQDSIDVQLEAFLGLQFAERLSDWHDQLVVVDADSNRRELVGIRKN